MFCVFFTPCWKCFVYKKAKYIVIKYSKNLCCGINLPFGFFSANFKRFLFKIANIQYHTNVRCTP